MQNSMQWHQYAIVFIWVVHQMDDRHHTAHAHYIPHRQSHSVVCSTSVHHIYTQGGVSDQLMSGDEVVSTGHDSATAAVQ